jgi:hypothetical protein
MSMKWTMTLPVDLGASFRHSGDRPHATDGWTLDGPRSSRIHSPDADDPSLPRSDDSLWSQSSYPMIHHYSDSPVPDLP